VGGRGYIHPPSTSYKTRIPLLSFHFAQFLQSDSQVFSRRDGQIQINYITRMQYFWLNGDIHDSALKHISIADRGFLLGDGLFETLRIISGQPQDFTEHWNRLTTSAEHYLLPISYTLEQVADAIEQLIRQNSAQNAVLRITVTRGGGGRGLAFDSQQPSTILLTLAGLPPILAYMDVCFASEVRSTGGTEWSHKALHFLPSIRQYNLALQNGYHEALWCNAQGCVLESCTANLFLIKGEELHTSPADGGILPGIVRAKVLRLAQEHGVQVRIHPIPVGDLGDYDSGFLTNSVRGMVQIRRLGAQLFSCQGNPLWEMLQKKCGNKESCG